MAVMMQQWCVAGKAYCSVVAPSLYASLLCGFECCPHRCRRAWPAVPPCSTLLHPGPQDEAQLARHVAEANVYSLASHQYWGTWSLLQV